MPRAWPKGCSEATWRWITIVLKKLVLGSEYVFVQVLTDLLLVSLVVHETSKWDSSLNFLYPLVIIVASVLLPRIWAHLVAAFAFILYGTVLELNYYGVVPSYCTTIRG